MQPLPPSQGHLVYEWAKDHVYVKSSLDLSDGRLTLVEDTLKPAFFLDRHHHKMMLEIFYILEGSVEFIFDDERVLAEPGTTLNVPPGIWHKVTSPTGAKLLTIFSPGGFDSYMEELVVLPSQHLAEDEREFIMAMIKSWEEGRAEARAEGSTNTQAQAVLTVLRSRGIAVPDAPRERILAQRDLEQLTRWLEKAAVASSIGEVLGDPS